MQVTTAIIFAAGYGSRMLPVTAAVQKELLPILNRPIIDYVVADCIAAGIKRIIFIISPGSHGLQDYYVGNPSLERHLNHYKKTEARDQLRAIHAQAAFEFIEQPGDAGYGTAVPVRLAIPHLAKGEACLVSDGDTFSWHANGVPEVVQLVRDFEASGTDGAIMGLEHPVSDLHRWGVLATKQEGDQELLTGLVEKPDPGQAPSNLINISKYILTPGVLSYVDGVEPNPQSGEYYLTDAIHAAAQAHSILVHRATGQLLDAGSVNGWLKANLAIAASDPELAAIIADHQAKPVK